MRLKKGGWFDRILVIAIVTLTVSSCNLTDFTCMTGAQNAVQLDIAHDHTGIVGGSRVGTIFGIYVPSDWSLLNATYNGFVSGNPVAINNMVATPAPAIPGCDFETEFFSAPPGYRIEYYFIPDDVRQETDTGDLALIYQHSGDDAGTIPVAATTAAHDGTDAACDSSDGDPNPLVVTALVEQCFIGRGVPTMSATSLGILAALFMLLAVVGFRMRAS